MSSLWLGTVSECHVLATSLCTYHLVLERCAILFKGFECPWILVNPVPDRYKAKIVFVKMSFKSF